MFGAFDQYVGGLWFVEHVGFWTISVSAMSAPWLALPFAIGCTQHRAGRAALLGLAGTGCALLGYFVMTLSPIEGVRPSSVVIPMFLHSQLHVIVPGLVTGPLYGWLGHRWHLAVLGQRRPRRGRVLLRAACSLAIWPAAWQREREHCGGHARRHRGDVAGSCSGCPSQTRNLT